MSSNNSPKTKKKGDGKKVQRTERREKIWVQTIFTNRTGEKDKNSLIVFHHIQIIKTTTNGATLIRRGAAELHILLPRCIDLPELADDDAAGAEVTADVPLLLLLILLLELIVVPVGGGAVVMSPLLKVDPVKARVVIDPVTERDVVDTVGESAEEPEDTDGDEEPGAGEEIRVMAKAGLVSPESPNKTIM